MCTAYRYIIILLYYIILCARYAKSAVAANLFGQRVTSLRYRRVNTYTHVRTHAQYTTEYDDTRLDVIIVVIIVYTYIEYYIILFAGVSLDFRNGKKK